MCDKRARVRALVCVRACPCVHPCMQNPLYPNRDCHPVCGFLCCSCGVTRERGLKLACDEKTHSISAGQADGGWCSFREVMKDVSTCSVSVIYLDAFYGSLVGHSGCVFMKKSLSVSL